MANLGEMFFHGQIEDPEHFFRDDPQGQQEFEQKQLDVFCDLCGERDSAPEKTLREAGWGLYPREQFCPRHEAEI